MRTILKKYFPYLLPVLAIILVAAFTPPGNPREQRIIDAFHNYLERHSASMLEALDTFGTKADSASLADPAKIPALKSSFLELRKAYKRMEPFSCYYFLASERNFNGPVVPEIEDETEDFPKIELPHGLQQMEAYLWDEQPALFAKNMKQEITLMNENLSSLHIAFKTLPTDEVKFIEAIQLQVLRTFTLGISQFDTPESKNALEETRVILISLHEVISDAYQPEMGAPQVKEVLNRLNQTLNYFNTQVSIDSLNFLECYRDYYVPLSNSLAMLRTGFVENNYYPSSALKLNAPSIFRGEAFNRFFYNPRGTDPEFSAEAAALGKALFFDPILSENNKRACASCHQPDKAFTDGSKTSSGFLEGEMLTRNAPTLINAALQRNYFYDLRADHLEGQIGHVLSNKKEMQSSFESAVKKLYKSPGYVSWFKRAFKGKEDTLISRTSIENAISEYERTLVSLNSKFDRNINGDEQTFSEGELNGFNVFMSKGKCATCHYLPLFNGVVPPFYTRSEFEIIGTTETPDTAHPKLDPDKGRGGLYGTRVFMNAFKTPTLRNIALTTPYMHNGAFANLEQVIDFYNLGGGAGMGLDIPNQTLPPDRLHLTEKEKNDLIVFLHTLTDTISMTSMPSRLPSFPDPSMNKRTIGGVY